MNNETIGYTPKELTRMPEVRQKIIEARFTPRLSIKDRRLSQLTEGELELAACLFN